LTNTPKVGLPYLLQQRLAEVQELVLLKVPDLVCLIRMEIIWSYPV